MPVKANLARHAPCVVLKAHLRCDASSGLAALWRWQLQLDHPRRVCPAIVSCDTAVESGPSAHQGPCAHDAGLIKSRSGLKKPDSEVFSLVFCISVSIMSQPAARISDMHACPAVAPGPVPHIGGPIVSGQPNVLIGFMPAARIGDTAVCVPMPDSVSSGATTVLIGGSPAARMGDSCSHGGVIVSGQLNVLIGNATATISGANKPCLATAAAARTPFLRA